MKNIKHTAASLFLLSSVMLSAQSIDLNKMPTPGPTPSINIAQPKTFKLKNGLTVLVVENHKLPRVNISLNIDRQPIYEGEIAGVGSIMSSQLGKGTQNMSKEKFESRIDFLGARLSFSSAGASANMLSKYFNEVIGLMSDAIINPKFSAEEIQKDKERTLESLKIDEKNTENIANKVSSALTYGKNSSRGEFETEASIKKIQPKDVEDFYKKYYAPDNAYLVIVGDVKFNEVKKLVEQKFSGWKKSNTKFSKLEEAKNVSSTEINFIDVPSAVQSVVSLENLTSLEMKNPQYFPSIIANYILGGGAEARLFMNLREKNGFTYGAYSRLSTSKYSPSFSASASVRSDITDKAVQEFINELKNIQNIKPEELENAKAKLKGSFIMSLESPQTIARFALNERLYNLPKDFYKNYLKSIDNVTISDVSKAAKNIILPNQSRIFIAGKASDLADKIEKLGYPVKYFDKDANPMQKPQVKKIDASVTTASVAQKYIDAIGGKAAAAKINSIKMTASAVVQGMPLTMINTYAKGGKTINELQMAGQTLQKLVFDGKDGYVEAQGKKNPLPAEQKTFLQKSKEVIPELDTENFSKTYEIKGIENINGEEVYVLKNADKTLYYSVKTGLKTGDITIIKSNGQEVSQPLYYSNYKVVEGVKFPSKITSNMGGMDINLEVQSFEINKAKDTDFK